MISTYVRFVKRKICEYGPELSRKAVWIGC
jgi:hypothetical protein